MKTKEEKKGEYRVKNWAKYNKSLVKRGNITVWIDEKLKEDWYYRGKHKRGGKTIFSDKAIEICLSFKNFFRLPYRQTQGLLIGFFERIHFRVKVPSYTQVNRRSRNISVDIKIAKSKGRDIDIVIDSTGLKVFGEGEWKTRKHGASRRRTWKKIHMASDGETLEILDLEVTGNEVDDAQSGKEIVERSQEAIASCSADGAYDKKKFLSALEEKNISPRIPPRKDAVLSNGEQGWQKHRDNAINHISKYGSKYWKECSGYHIRSKSEVNMYRFKQAFGEKLTSRENRRQITEGRIKSKILNWQQFIGMPESYRIAS